MIALAAAALRLVAVHLMLAVLGAPRTRRFVDRRQGSAIDPARAEQTARAVQRAARRLPLRTNCLDQALTLAWLMRGAGLQATVRFGVRHDSHESHKSQSHEFHLIAHAWVEHAGQPLLDDASLHFIPLT